MKRYSVLVHTGIDAETEEEAKNQVEWVMNTADASSLLYISVGSVLKIKEVGGKNNAEV